jgi:hypothetical protein
VERQQEGGGLDVGDQLRDRLAAHEGRLAAYEAIAARDFGGELDRRARLQRAILEAGMSYERQWIAWCTDVAELLAADPGD